MPAPYVGAPLVSVPSDAGDLWMREDDGVIRPFIEAAGTWERDEGAFLRRHVRDGDTFVDIGANIGYFSRLIGRETPVGRIVAVEPHPELVPVLRLNLWSLTVPHRVLACAASDSRGTVSLSSAAHNIGDTRATAEVVGVQSSLVAASAPLDDLVSGRVDVVKIDVQGFEPEVLRGMQRILRENPEILIVSEFWPEALRGRGLDPRRVLEHYRHMGLVVRQLQNGSALDVRDDEILEFCTSAGTDGQANLVLRQS